MQQLWFLDGPWTSVAADDTQGRIYVLGRQGKCTELDWAGKTQREIKLAAQGSILRLVSLPGGTKGFLTFTAWSGDLEAWNANGKSLWTYPRQEGIDDVWTSDLDGDGRDKVIVGFNGMTGLHVLDADGKLLWNMPGLGNVWHVCAGDVLGTGKPQVVTTCAAGRVHVFTEGKKVTDFQAGCYATMVRTAKLSGQDKSAMIFVAGSGLGGARGAEAGVLAALTGEGVKKWSLELPGGPKVYVISAQVAPGRPWLAVGTGGGQVHVVDVAKGEIVASLNGQGSSPEVGWATSKGEVPATLLVATGSQVATYRVGK